MSCGTKVPDGRDHRTWRMTLPWSCTEGMSQGVTVEPQGEVPPGASGVRSSGPTPPLAETDPVGVLLQVLHRSDDVVGPRPRPFDAQYWACWVVAVALPLLVAYLLWTR